MVQADQCEVSRKTGDIISPNTGLPTPLPFDRPVTLLGLTLTQDALFPFPREMRKL